MGNKITKEELLKLIKKEVEYDIQNEVFKKGNPWAICHASTGPKKTDKFEKCVKDVKKKVGMDEEKKHDPEATLRNRGSVIFPAESSRVIDDKDHFPINDIDEARNALARANQYKTVPAWYKGSLRDLVKTVHTKVKNTFPNIHTTEKSIKPGKG